MEKGFLSYEVLRVFERTNKNGVAIIPSLDQAASCGDIIDEGRIIRCELDWDEKSAKEAAREFSDLVDDLYDIGYWYLNSGNNLGSCPQEDSFEDPETMEVWKKYLEGFPYEGFSKENILEFCDSHKIEGYAKDLFEFMLFRFIKYITLGAPEMAVIIARADLAYAFVINCFAKKAETIDRFMDKPCDKSYFPKRQEFTDDDSTSVFEFMCCDECTLVTEKASKFFDSMLV